MVNRFLLSVTLLALLVGCGAAGAPPEAMVTIIGYTQSTGERVTELNVWKDRPGVFPARTVGNVREGTQVPMYSHDAESALIGLPDGTRGYIGVEFIQELR